MRLELRTKQPAHAVLNFWEQTHAYMQTQTHIHTEKERQRQRDIANISV